MMKLSEMLLAHIMIIDTFSHLAHHRGHGPTADEGWQQN